MSTLPIKFDLSEVKKILEQTELTMAEQNEFVGFLNNLRDDDLEEIVLFLKEKPFYARGLVNLYRELKGAIGRNDAVLLNDALIRLSTSLERITESN